MRRIIDRLPPYSRYVSAIYDDPEIAPELARMPEPENPEISMFGFDPERSLLSALLDAINNNTAAVIACAGSDPPKFNPAPRPVTEVDRIRNRLRHDSRRELAALMLGKDISEIE